ncbi:hypothetical protein ACQPXB_40690 [Amycolatopsis sp. CA-161197]|uniref:hypothetical protein n=1 Tax=Amycolatopsis sp. CA-161197 TaxID=3239922 RepID=UPI003D93097D
MLADVLTLKMNDAAAKAMDVLSGFGRIEPPGGLAHDLRERVARGLRRRGKVLTWADSTADADNAPSFFPDLTFWECSDSSFHLEDFVQVDVATVDDQPFISEDDQRLLLMHGVALAREMSRAVYALEPPSPVRCIIGANETNATFRFHQIRAGEYWNLPDLDSYRQDKMVVIDIEPAGLTPGRVGPFDRGGTH